MASDYCSCCESNIGHIMQHYDPDGHITSKDTAEEVLARFQECFSGECDLDLADVEEYIEHLGGGLRYTGDNYDEIEAALVNLGASPAEADGLTDILHEEGWGGDEEGELTDQLLSQMIDWYRQFRGDDADFADD